MSDSYIKDWVKVGNATSALWAVAIPPPDAIKPKPVRQRKSK